MNSTMDRAQAEPKPDRPRDVSELANLLDSTARGDRAAFADLYQRTSAKLYGICLRLLGSQAEAQDVLQDVYVTVWQKAHRFDPARASPITWLAVVARNKGIDRLRQRPVQVEELEAAAGVQDDAPLAFDIIDRERDSARLTHCLDELEERPRAMIRSAFLDGATYPELAEREGVPLGTMKSWIRRGLQRLKGCLEQ
ncbi:sigma-70 family RNA polymerase sigma factor [Sphingomonas lutea]|nr:sigma-70 family RNA polymerase sigma factor [Sphingomonas lutea]